MHHFNLAATLFFMTALSATAQDIRWKSETMTKGDFVSIHQSQKGLTHHVFAGRRGKAFVLHTYRGTKPKGKPVFTTYLDRDGNYLRWVHSQGHSTTFKPHDCTRTLGKCQYRIVQSDGKRESRTRITELASGGFTFKEYNADGAFLFGGKIKIDHRGMAGDGHISGNNGKQRFRLIARSYR